jgi:hypothetical protein
VDRSTKNSTVGATPVEKVFIPNYYVGLEICLRSGLDISLHDEVHVPTQCGPVCQPLHGERTKAHDLRIRSKRRANSVKQFLLAFTHWQKILYSSMKSSGA